MHKLLYFSENQIGRLRQALAQYHASITADPAYAQYAKHWSQEQWEFFDKFFKANAEVSLREITLSLSSENEEIRKAIHHGQIFKFIQHEIFYELTFSAMNLLVPVREEKTGNRTSIIFEPRSVSLASLLNDANEFNAIVSIIDSHIGSLVQHYQGHRVLASLHAANIVIEDPYINWSFGGVNFIAENNITYRNLYQRWTRSPYRHGSLFEKVNIGIIKFKGASAHKAMVISLVHFNRVYNCLKMLAELRLNKQYWMTRDRLEIPNQSIAIMSSHDNPMWSAIESSLDNDFFSAIKSNSMYKPLIINKANIAAIDSYENIDSINLLLRRSLSESANELDHKIYNAQSWFSESQKSFIPPHKYVGFVTAIETLLTNKALLDGNTSDKGLSEMLAERGAILLKDTYPERLIIKKELKRMYGIRSKIVHGSDREIGKRDPYDFMNSATVIEINKVQKMSADVIAKIIQVAEANNIRSIPELNEYFQEKLLS